MTLRKLSQKQAALLERAATLLRPSERLTVDEWARRNRRYRPSAGKPGPRDPSLTPYVIEPARVYDVGYQLRAYGRRYDATAFVTSSQSGKTDMALDVIGSNADQTPSPLLYMGPTEVFVTREIEPRLSEMLAGSTFKDRVALGKRNTRHRKLVNGAPIALGWAGSAAMLAGMAAKKVIFDEVDRMAANVQGEGDPLTLGEARGYSFADRMMGAISTPLLGLVDVYLCEASGLVFWKPMEAEDVQSPIWRFWQSGTMHHWAWPCPHCSAYFVPRSDLLAVPEGATASEARREAHLRCPSCGGKVEEQHKRAMNAAGRYVAPGQRVNAQGKVTGAPPEATRITFWASGLCSPFVTFGERAASLVAARLSKSQEKLQGVYNTAFGELFKPSAGDAPEWHEVAALRRNFRQRTLPDWVQRLTLAVDVQRRRLIYSIRGWGAFGSSCTIEAGEIHGHTTQDHVWGQLALIVAEPIAGLPIERALVDSGFRPGKPESVPMNRVYQFCRRFRGRVFPSKGRRTADKPVAVRKADITARGDVHRYGLDLVWIDTDWAKSAVHEKIRWETDAPGEWVLAEDVTDDFCKQIVAESRTWTETGQPIWTATSRENHFLDTEAMQEALGHWLGLHRLREQSVEAREKALAAGAQHPHAPKPKQGRERSDDTRAARITALRERIRKNKENPRRATAR